MALPLPTYATIADYLDYSEGATVSNEAAANRLLYRAERQVDKVLVGQIGAIAATGLKWDPLTLQVDIRRKLSNAVCAQAEYRFYMEEQFFIRDQRQRESTPDMTLEGKVGRIAPKVYEELTGTGLLLTGARLTSNGATRVTTPAYPYRWW